MDKWERNSSREAMRPKGETLEWWSFSSRGVGLHVYNRNNEGWHWKINLPVDVESQYPYETMRGAMTVCVDVALRESKRIVSTIQNDTAWIDAAQPARG